MFSLWNKNKYKAKKMCVIILCFIKENVFVIRSWKLFASVVWFAGYKKTLLEIIVTTFLAIKSAKNNEKRKRKHGKPQNTYFWHLLKVRVDRKGCRPSRGFGKLSPSHSGRILQSVEERDTSMAYHKPRKADVRFNLFPSPHHYLSESSVYGDRGWARETDKTSNVVAVTHARYIDCEGKRPCEWSSTTHGRVSLSTVWRV